MFSARTSPRNVSDDDRGQRDERRLDQEDGLHHSAPEADRPQHTDLLAALDDGARADHAERCDPDDQAEAHEALDHPVERAVGGDGVVDDLLDRLGLHPVREEGRFELRRGRRRGRHRGRARSSGSSARTARGTRAGRWPASSRCRPSRAGAVSFRIPITVSRRWRPVCGSRIVIGIGSKTPSSNVKPLSWKSGSTREVEVVAARSDGRVDDCEPGAGRQRVPDLVDASGSRARSRRARRSCGGGMIWSSPRAT